MACGGEDEAVSADLVEGSPAWAPPLVFGVEVRGAVARAFRIQMNPTDRWRRFADSGDPNPLVMNHIRPLENESFEELFVDIYVLKQW